MGFPQLLLLNTLLGISTLHLSRTTAEQNGKPRSFRKVYICIVTKGNNIETVRRTYHNVVLASRFDCRCEVVIVTDAPCAAELLTLGVRVETTPRDFAPQKARFKARSLDYLRFALQLQPQDWVLHLDEESTVDEHALIACIDFIKHGEYEFGQGIILYNDLSYWRHPFLTVMDVTRVADDLGKLYFQNNVTHASICGVRGSFLLASGRLECHVGWDTACLTEDYDFAWKAWSQGFRCGWIPSICREQSPCSLSDCIQQRRRWYHGVWSSGYVFGRVQLLAALIFSVAPIFAIIYCMFIGQPPHLPFWAWTELIVVWAAELATKCLACLLQDYDAQIPASELAYHQLTLLSLAYIAELFERASCLYGILYPPQDFFVVQKG